MGQKKTKKKKIKKKCGHRLGGNDGPMLRAQMSNKLNAVIIDPIKKKTPIYAITD